MSLILVYHYWNSHEEICDGELLQITADRGISPEMEFRDELWLQHL
jgi:hypothetical protein